MLRFDEPKVSKERIANRSRQRSVPVFISFADTDDNFVLRKINILDAQSAAFYQPQAGAVEQ